MIESKSETSASTCKASVALIRGPLLTTDVIAIVILEVCLQASIEDCEALTHDPGGSHSIRDSWYAKMHAFGLLGHHYLARFTLGTCSVV